jgi:hypothetical protein
LLYSTAGPASGMPIDYAPAPFQKIFKLEKFFPNYSEDASDQNIVARPDGSLGLRKGSKKISSPSAWMVAANGLGRYLAHLSASQKETEFTWNEFHVFTDWVHAYFSAYSFDSVLLFEQAYRRWRRFHKLPWSSDNSFLKDLLCRPKIDLPGKSPASPSGATPTCKNFNRPSGCSNAKCRYKHVCHDCRSSEHGISGCSLYSKSPVKGSGGQ